MLDFGGAIVGVHVVSGTIAVLAGAAALAVRKGAATHIGAGRTFTIAMALSSAVGAALGLIRVDAFYITFHAGVFGRHPNPGRLADRADALVSLDPRQRLGRGCQWAQHDRLGCCRCVRVVSARR